jgi:hypothetical protein
MKYIWQQNKDHPFRTVNTFDPIFLEVSKWDAPGRSGHVLMGVIWGKDQGKYKIYATKTQILFDINNEGVWIELQTWCEEELDKRIQSGEIKCKT